MNKVILCGNLVRDAEIRISKNDKKLALMTIATNRYINDENVVEYTDVVKFNIVGKQEDYLKKGAKLLVEGYLKTEFYRNKEGKEIKQIKIIVDSMEIVKFAGSNNYEKEKIVNVENGFVDAYEKQKQAKVKEPESEELPF